MRDNCSLCLRKWTKQYCCEQWRHTAHLAVEHVRSSHAVNEIPDEERPLDSVAIGDALSDDILLLCCLKKTVRSIMHVLTADRTTNKQKKLDGEGEEE